MTTKDLKEWADSLYKEYGDIECFFRDYDCHAYRNVDDIFKNVAYYGKLDNNKVLILDLPKHD